MSEGLVYWLIKYLMKKVFVTLTTSTRDASASKKVSNSSFEILTFLQNSQSMSSACEFWREGSILYIICYIKQELDLFTMHPFESAKKMGAGCSDENGG